MEKYILYTETPQEPIPVYMNVSAHNVEFFDSLDSARQSNCHGVYADKTKYKVAKVKLEIVEEDVDPPTEEELKEAEIKNGFENPMDYHLFNLMRKEYREGQLI